MAAVMDMAMVNQRKNGGVFDFLVKYINGIMY